MKTFITSILLLCSAAAFAQNITNTLGVGGLFKIKDGASTFFTLTQSTGLVSLSKGLDLPVTTNSTTGVLTRGGARFMHSYDPAGLGLNVFLGYNAGNFTMSGADPYGRYNTGVGNYALSSNTTGYRNSAFGVSSLTANTTGYQNSALGFGSLYSNTTGYQNSAFGYNSLLNNTTGFQNSAFGFYSLNSNSTGSYNSAFGYQSLFSTTVGYNSAFGYKSMYSNTTGGNNSAFGYYSLFSNILGAGNSAFGNYVLASNTNGLSNSAFGDVCLNANTTGNDNSAFGWESMVNNTTGSFNTAFGEHSLYHNTTSSGNSAFGDESLYNSTGSDNTAVGFGSGTTITTGSNNTTIGNDAQVPTPTGNGQVRIGDVWVFYAGIQVAWTITSDRKWKQNILPTKLGLNFISKLNPVSYTRINDESQKSEYGFIGQEVDSLLKESKVDNPGMITITDEGKYELRYNDLLAPMVKAIQELKSENDQLKERLLKLEEKINQTKIIEVSK